jgi:hypothetical protein
VIITVLLDADRERQDTLLPYNTDDIEVLAL